MQIETRLKEMGLKLPAPGKPMANYVSAVRTGNLVFLSGHGPVLDDGSLITGKVGTDLTLDEGYNAARQVARVAIRPGDRLRTLLPELPEEGEVRVAITPWTEIAATFAAPSFTSDLVVMVPQLD